MDGVEMETECQALNRDVTPRECIEAQKEFPVKFCKGCDWFTKQADTQGKAGYVPFTYKIRIGNELRTILIEEARRRNIQPRDFIVRILAESLLK